MPTAVWRWAQIAEDDTPVSPTGLAGCTGSSCQAFAACRAGLERAFAAGVENQGAVWWERVFRTWVLT